MLPDAEIRTIDLKGPGPVDGDQKLKFHVVSLKAEFRQFMQILPFVTKYIRRLSLD